MKITGGAEHIGSFSKTPKSVRKWCKLCGGHLLAEHPAQRLVEVYASVPPWAHLPDVPANVRFLDIADRVCGPDRCPAVVGNVLVYLDDNPLTASYSASMAPLIEGDVLAALGF